MMLILDVLLMTVMMSGATIFGMEKESRQSLIERLGDKPNGIWACEYEKQGWTIDQALVDHRKENPSFHELIYYRYEKLKEIIEQNHSMFEGIAPKIRALAQQDKGWKQLVDRKCHTEPLLYYINAHLTNNALYKTGFDRSVRNEGLYIYLELAAALLGTKGAIEFGKEFIQQDSAKQRLKNFLFEIVQYGGSRPHSCDMMLSWPDEDRDVVEAGLKMGLEPDMLSNADGWTPKGVPLLIKAIDVHKIKVVELLLDWKADKDIQYAYRTERADDDWRKEVPEYIRSYTALHKAIQLDEQAIADLLIQRGANVNALDNFGRTPLMWAARGGCVAGVETLLAAKAITWLIDEYDKCALDYAQERLSNVDQETSKRFLVWDQKRIAKAEKEKYNKIINLLESAK
jgi:hypothetical protein